MFAHSPHSVFCVFVLSRDQLLSIPSHFITVVLGHVYLIDRKCCVWHCPVALSARISFAASLLCSTFTVSCSVTSRCSSLCPMFPMELPMMKGLEGATLELEFEATVCKPVSLHIPGHLDGITIRSWMENLLLMLKMQRYRFLAAASLFRMLEVFEHLSSAFAWQQFSV